jgi:hypothetical protein
MKCRPQVTVPLCVNFSSYEVATREAYSLGRILPRARSAFCQECILPDRKGGRGSSSAPEAPMLTPHVIERVLIRRASDLLWKVGKKTPL